MRNRRHPTSTPCSMIFFRGRRMWPQAMESADPEGSGVRVAWETKSRKPRREAKFRVYRTGGWRCKVLPVGPRRPSLVKQTLTTIVATIDQSSSRALQQA